MHLPQPPKPFQLSFHVLIFFNLYIFFSMYYFHFLIYSIKAIFVSLFCFLETMLFTQLLMDKFYNVIVSSFIVGRDKPL